MNKSPVVFLIRVLASLFFNSEPNTNLINQLNQIEEFQQTDFFLKSAPQKSFALCKVKSHQLVFIFVVLIEKPSNILNSSGQFFVFFFFVQQIQLS